MVKAVAKIISLTMLPREAKHKQTSKRVLRERDSYGDGRV